MTQRALNSGAEAQGELWLESHGARILIRSEDASVLDAFQLPFAAAIASPRDADAEFQISMRPEGGYHLRWAGDGSSRFDSTTALLRRLTSHVDLAIAEHARDALFLHAGVVALHGYNIAIPGPSGSGKTTLVLEAIRRGATFFSDEYAVVDREGLVHPYGRPLGVRGRRGKTALDPASLGVETGKGPVAIDILLICQYEAGAHWKPNFPAPGEAVFDLVANTVAAASRPEDTLERMTLMARGARAWKGPRGESGAVLDMILP